ncbi:MAG: phosphoribosylaminoimidazolesuccinocarboxamide synthase [Candidatus Shapirobacteria bacterium]|nr:phosphoribosylaminoimidazolesuccinocarboxamide synthase [Candidatus Shapirobacteria bacterium]
MVSENEIKNALDSVLKTIDVDFLGEKHQGKVRDYFKINGKRILITTDRQSAFDVILGHIPFKGTVLNLLTQFWLDNTKDIIPNYLISVPDPNVIVGHECQLIPLEMIVRGYITGVTNTSLWTAYKDGKREFCGNSLPEGLVKNQKLPQPIVTPSTHGAPGTHDVNLSKKEIVEQGIVSPEIYFQMETAALKLFQRGTEICQQKGIILVDTKYEFGLLNGQVVLIDEIHTPDSSRFWKADTYQERFDQNLEPENFDKEFIRLWYVEHGYSGQGQPPQMPIELIIAASQRYIANYELITGQAFPIYQYPINQRIIDNLKKINL